MTRRNIANPLSPRIAGLLAIAVCLAPGLLANDFTVAGLDADEVVGRMIEMNQARAVALQEYTSERHYIADNPHFSKRAEVAVQELYVQPGTKDLKIISASGSAIIQHKVIDKLIEAEIEAARQENRDQTYVTPQNYEFRLIGVEEIDDRSCYALAVTPRVPKKYLMQGEIWVDTSEFAIVRMEGSPAKNPSFWTRKVHFVRRYSKHGQFWLPASVESESELWIAGKSTLRIEYSDYKIDAGTEAQIDESGPSALKEPLDGPKR